MKIVEKGKSLKLRYLIGPFTICGLSKTYIVRKVQPIVGNTIEQLVWSHTTLIYLLYILFLDLQ